MGAKNLAQGRKDESVYQQPVFVSEYKERPDCAYDC